MHYNKFSKFFKKDHCLEDHKFFKNKKNEMMIKFCLTLAFLLILQIFSLSTIQGEMEPDSTKMEHDPSKDLPELLEGEDVSKFFTNQNSGDFQTNFVRKLIHN